MNIMKKTLSLFLVVVTMFTAFVLPAHAQTLAPSTRASSFQTRDFKYFPRVNASMGGYMVATVAVQKFLMLYGDSLAKQIMASGGTDGYFGSSTKNAVSTFQSRTGLGADGDVGQKTWEKIGESLTATELPEVCTTYTHYNRSYYDLDERVILYVSSYQAVDQSGNVVPTPFYPY